MEKHYVPQTGESIEYAIRQAKKLAEGDEDVRLTFNDIDLNIRKDSDEDAVVVEFLDKCREQGEKLAQHHAMKISALMPGLPAVIDGGLNTLVPWIKTYARNAGAPFVAREDIIDKLGRAGYQPGTPTFTDWQTDEKEKLGELIVRRFMLDLTEGEEIHPMLENIADDYIRMPDPPQPGSNNPPPKFKP